jgi:hypothetical protein
MSKILMMDCDFNDPACDPAGEWGDIDDFKGSSQSYENITAHSGASRSKSSFGDETVLGGLLAIAGFTAGAYFVGKPTFDFLSQYDLFDPGKLETVVDFYFTTFVSAPVGIFAGHVGNIVGTLLSPSTYR